MTFDLWQHTRAILAESSEESLDTLTEAVLKGIPKSASREALAQALPHYIRRALSLADRPTAESGHPVVDTQGELAGLSPSTAGQGQTRHEGQASLTPSGGQNLARSRVALFRKNRFRLSIWVGDRTYRNILDCTIGDLEFAAAESDRHAASNAAAARRYRRLTKLMTEKRVEKVAELTDAEIEEALSDEP